LRDQLTRRDKIVFGLRNITSYLPKLHLCERPRKDDGVTFIIPVKNEENTIRSSILSITDDATEVIVVDSSTDRTTEIVAGLAAKNDKIKHMQLYYSGNNAIALARDLALMNVKTKWVFDWEGDQVVKPEDLKGWISKLKTLDKDRHYVIDIPRLNFSCDLMHLQKSMPFGWQGRLYTWSYQLRYIIDSRAGYGQEHVVGDSIWGSRLPPWYKLLRWNGPPYAYHLNFKNTKRLVERQFWENYMKDSEGYDCLENYTLYRLAKQNLTMEQARAIMALKMKEDTIPYDRERYGQLPSILNDLTFTDALA
jgi:glycosyltransferase involved in cell wall biosynthesis